MPARDYHFILSSIAMMIFDAASARARARGFTTEDATSAASCGLRDAAKMMMPRAHTMLFVRN